MKLLIVCSLLFLVSCGKEIHNHATEKEVIVEDVRVHEEFNAQFKQPNGQKYFATVKVIEQENGKIRVEIKSYRTTQGETFKATEL